MDMKQCLANSVLTAIVCIDSLLLRVEGEHSSSVSNVISRVYEYALILYFVSGRWMCGESIRSDGTHHCDWPAGNRLFVRKREKTVCSGGEAILNRYAMLKIVVKLCTKLYKGGM